MIKLLSNKSLFPTKWSFAIFIFYMGFFINQGLLVTSSRNGKKHYPYNPGMVVLLTEFVKLIISICVQIYKEGITNFLQNVYKNSSLLLSYIIPALLYVIYNNLSFLNLSYFEPTIYFLLMQIRLFLTGIIYQIVFHKKLTKTQWLSLLLITVGCMIQKLNIGNLSQMKYTTHWSDVFNVGVGTVMIILQASCSVLAGVYNEYILKTKGVQSDISIQNIFMCIDSVFCNLTLVIPFIDAEERKIKPFIYKTYKHPIVLWIILNNSCAGLVTSLFLKDMNSILKAFASALELILTAILSYFFLGIKTDLNTMAAIGIVSYAVVLYAKNPVLNEPSLPLVTETKPSKREKPK